MFKIFLILIFHFFSKTFSNQISFPFKFINNIHPTINLCLGTPIQCFNFIITTYMNESFIIDGSFYKNGFLSNESSSFKLINDNIKTYYDYMYSRTYFGIIFNEKVTSKENNLNINFNFYLVNKGFFTDGNYSGILGLGKTNIYKNNSFLHILYKNNLISSKEFYFNNDKIYFGNSNNENIKYLYNKISKSSKEMYKAKIESIIFYNKKNFRLTDSYKKKQNIFFNPSTEGIICPRKFFNYLRDIIFVEFIDRINNLCYSQEYRNYGLIKCDYNIIENYLGKIYFLFGKWNINFDLKDLFIKEEIDKLNEKISNKMIFEISSINYEDIWIFGYPFFKKYDVWFDESNEEIRIKNK